jgi:hypothetical protein
MSGSKLSPPAAAEARPSLAADQPLGLTVHAMPAPADLARRHWGRVKMVLVLLVCAAPVIASYFTFYVIRPGSGAAAYGTLITPPRPLPALAGVDLDGRPRPLPALSGQWLLVVLGGGACATDCEHRLFMQRQLREMTGRERDRIDKLWLVTDDAPVAPALRAALDATPAMHIVRLPRAAVAGWLQPANGQVLEDHLYLVDPLGQWMMRMPAAADPAKVRRDIDRLLRAAASWDKPGRTPSAAALPAGASRPVP